MGCLDCVSVCVRVCACVRVYVQRVVFVCGGLVVDGSRDGSVSGHYARGRIWQRTLCQRTNLPVDTPLSRSDMNTVPYRPLT